MKKTLKTKAENKMIEKFGPKKSNVVAGKVSPVTKSKAITKAAAKRVDNLSLRGEKTTIAAKRAPVFIEVEQELVAEKKETKNLVLKIFLILFAMLLILGSFATAYYFYNKYKTVPSVETDDVVSKIGKFMQLSETEKPTLATVTDKEKMKEQPFFAKAENGDKVLIYTQEKRAILYRPSINKIIEVMPLSPGKIQEPKEEQMTTGSVEQIQQTENVVAQEETQVQTQPAVPVEPIKLNVAVYNGSGVRNKAKTVGDEIAKIEGMTVIEKTNATGNFDATVVVDLTGNNAEHAQKIADALGATVGELPVGEVSPKADILVVSGKK